MASVRAGLRTLWHDNRSLILFLLLMAIFRSSLADWNSVPTSSMQPTIVPGDRILVDKLAYDVRVPFLHTSLYRLDDPARGDIVVFDSRVSDKRLVKRVIGIPGDTVELRANRLWLNGVAVAYSADVPTPGGVDMFEALPGAPHAVHLRATPSGLASFDPVVVPAGHYLVLGDNRDNSADSRVIGFVPRDEIVGRSRRVVLSFDYDDFYLPRAERWLQPL